jgi:hypothetical protein
LWRFDRFQACVGRAALARIANQVGPVARPETLVVSTGEITMLPLESETQTARAPSIDPAVLDGPFHPDQILGESVDTASGLAK